MKTRFQLLVLAAYLFLSSGSLALAKWSESGTSQPAFLNAGERQVALALLNDSTAQLETSP